MGFPLDERAHRTATIFVKYCFSQSTVSRHFGVQTELWLPDSPTPRFDDSPSASFLWPQGWLPTPNPEQPLVFSAVFAVLMSRPPSILVDDAIFDLPDDPV